VRIDHAPTLLLWEIARDGLPLLAEPESAWHAFRARASSEWFDFEPAYRRALALYTRRVAAGASP